MTTIVCPMLGSMMEAGLPVLTALIYVRESERIGTTSPENLKPLYGPTDAEARVAASLAEGASLQNIAADASVETLRTHRKRVMGKVGVNRRSELAVILLNSAAARQPLQGLNRSATSAAGRSSPAALPLLRGTLPAHWTSAENQPTWARRALHPPRMPHSR